MPTKNLLEKRLFEAPITVTRLSKVRVSRPKKSLDSMLLELPQLIDWLALATANGMSIYQALVEVSERAEGQVADLLKKMCLELHLGSSFEQALSNLQHSNKSKALAEFCNRLALSLQRGTPVANQLRAIADSSRAELRNQLLAKAAANEIKLLLPLVFMILPVTVWFAIFPSLQLLQLGF